MKDIIIAKDKEDLKYIIHKEVELNGNKCDLNHIDISIVTDMSYLFSYTDFNGDISRWDVSKVIDMSGMFKDSQFNSDISKWNVSSVIEMDYMFANTQFHGDISSWDVSNVKSMNYMFFNSQYNENISSWNVEKVTIMENIFLHNNSSNQPWWAIEDNDKRKEAIDNYKLMQKLDDKLTSKEIIQPKKNKI